MKENRKSFDDTIMDYIDQMIHLFTQGKWQNVIMDCSKNELFILWYLYRHHEANMSQLAECIHVPLNTLTGIISRMEKKQLVQRIRSTEDKRVVVIQMDDCGKQQIQNVLKNVFFYGGKLFEEFEPEEIQLIFRMIDKIISIMTEENNSTLEKKKVRKIEIE